MRRVGWGVWRLEGSGSGDAVAVVAWLRDWLVARLLACSWKARGEREDLRGRCCPLAAMRDGRSVAIVVDVAV